MGKIDQATLKKMIKENEITTIIIAAADMQGRLFGKRCSAKYFLEEALKGVHTCTVNLIWDIEQNLGENYIFSNWDTGFQDIKAIPDLSTMRIYPWFEKTAIVLADLYLEEGGEVTLGPRNMLRRQIDKAKALGFEAKMASELEFYMLNETADSAREKGYANLTALSHNSADYSIYRSSCDEWILGKMRHLLDDAGLEVECTKAEWGHGQVELNLMYTETMEMADRTVIMKNGIKEIAFLNNIMVTFMAKYETEVTGSSFHLHASLWNEKGENVLADTSDAYGLSEVGKNFLGGMMQLAPELMCFYAPYVNSYKRLADTAGAPNTLSWGFDNRTLSFRVVGSGPSKRVENRIPGADGNPYLVLAATLASGLYGIEKKIALPGPPVLKNASAMPGITKLPRNLMEAVTLFENSKTVRELFGDDVVDHYTIATRNEIDDFFKHVTDWEKRRYLEQI